MGLRMKIKVIDLMVVGVLAGLIGYSVMNRPKRVDPAPPSFAEKVDLGPFNKIAVNADGRLRSFESHAKAYMGMISGPRSLGGHSNGFSYLDLIFRPDNYDNVDIVYVKNKQVRQQMLDLLKSQSLVDAARYDTIMKSGLFSRTLLENQAVQNLLQKLGEDLIRTAKVVNAINDGLAVSDSRLLTRELRVVAPPSGEENSPWLSIGEMVAAAGAPNDDNHAGLMQKDKRLAGLSDEFTREAANEWQALQSAWRGEDANAVNAHIAKLAAMFPTISPQLYPAENRLSLESWYFRNKSMTWVWYLYVAAIAPLLMSIIYKWDRARAIGMALFVIAFGAHTASLGVRWYISGRWPNSNMFEAVTTAAWLGGVLAIGLEWFTRRTAFRNLFALGSGVMSMLALMAAYFLPADLTSTINNKMAALNDVWLYIHTNMIILSYAIIGIACIPALLMLRHRWCLAWDNGSIHKIRLVVLPIALGVLNLTAYYLVMHAIDPIGHGLSRNALLASAGALAGSFFVVASEIMSIRERRRAGELRVEKAASGGAASLILSNKATSPFLKPEAQTSSQVLDGATMVLVELSFITLFVGTVMGAIWADHSWGRPWGWDPKEVFALNTFIIYLILVHVRFKVRDKGLWTAVLAVIGFEVMMFNWIVVNFVISGLHSYA